MSSRYDALLIVAFGGPEGMDDVMPFLANVSRGRNVPPQRLQEVAHHYEQFGGVSPLNQQIRDLIDCLKRELAEHDINLPVYWGNRNWRTMIEDTIKQMTADGVRRAMAFVVSAFSSYSGCRQYRQDIERARAAAGPDAPQIDKLRLFYNHRGFIEAMTDRVREALATIPQARRNTTRLVLTAHSIPKSMADGCQYEAQLRDAGRLVADAVGHSDWTLVYQSRSGPPDQPWLEPDVCDYLRQVKQAGRISDVVLVPIGFTSDHMEVVYDLDTEARQVCDQIGLNMVRAAAVGTHRRFVSMIRQLIQERMSSTGDRPALGALGPAPDICPANCCPPPRRPHAAR